MSARLQHVWSRLRQPRRSTLLVAALVLLVLVFVPLIVASSRWLHATRIDLTADRLYTLTPGTLKVVDSLQRPLRLTLYFSAHAARDLPQLRSYEQRVREMLQEMVARSRGHIRLQLIDPVPYSDDEASAEGAGLTAANGGSNGERVFFGLAGSAMSGPLDGDAGDERSAERTLAISFFDPAREAFLEYDIAKLLYELNQTHKPDIAILTTLPIQGNPALGEQPWAALQQLEPLFTLRTLDPATLERVDPSIKVLLLIHPGKLAPAAQYAVDQYVLGGGHLALFVDPMAEMARPALGVPDEATEDDVGVARLLKAWGVVYDPRRVVLDRARALQIELGGSNFNHPAMLDLGTAELNREDVITSSLQRINVSTAGHFDLAPSATTRLSPLLQTSAEAQVVSRKTVEASAGDPTQLLRNYVPDNTHYVLAARLHGPMVSAFPEFAARPGHRATSAARAEVILVADTDLLSDRLWVEPQTILGQTMMRVFANNGDFITNLVDNLSGSSALLSIRGRSTSQRPFTRVQALRNVADQKFLQKEYELEQELAETRKRLDELQPGKSAASGAASAEQRREIEQFRQRQLAINKELRDVQHQLNAEIDALGLRLKVINITLVPGLLVLIGLLYGWRRTRRSRRRR